MIRFSLFFTVCVDSLAWAIVFPIFAPFFLSASHLFSQATSLEKKMIILGCFLAIFSIGQFVGAPLLGALADRKGNRVALLWTIWMTFIGFLITSFGIYLEQLILLFLGRVITGFFSANVSICQSALSTLPDRKPIQNDDFSNLAFIVGISFILGAFLGGKLSDPSIYHGFSPSLPLWVATFMCLINFIIFWFCYPIKSPNQSNEKSILLHDLIKSFYDKKIRLAFATYFLFLFTWTIIFQFTPIVLVRSYAYTSSNIADLVILIGICWSLGSGYLSKMLPSSDRILEICLGLISLLTFLFLFSNQIYQDLLLVCFIIIMGGVAWPIYSNIIANLSSPKERGKVLGVSQSIQSIAMGTAPIVAGATYSIYPSFPFILGAFSSLFAAVIYVYNTRKNGAS